MLHSQNAMSFVSIRTVGLNVEKKRNYCGFGYICGVFRARWVYYIQYVVLMYLRGETRVNVLNGNVSLSEVK